MQPNCAPAQEIGCAFKQQRLLLGAAVLKRNPLVIPLKLRDWSIVAELRDALLLAPRNHLSKLRAGSAVSMVLHRSMAQPPLEPPLIG
ncbi:hypothetical protein MPL3356_250012 [Mesorhizobium plurifarium]|uniref:Uncharacterized protein n=1 Tax=Mesorhizobium plurifarium TaxID=69974 RepID=A0A090DTE9_MESPL|nr:hypothetical protein MPLB_1680069 [Mesorhizobium sp. ORS 3324]CDX17876.1 hypothetical protein MPL3356_250012 [Mesorhizobium plurifarium]